MKMSLIKLLIMGKKILKAFEIFHFITHKCKGLNPLRAYIPEGLELLK